MLGVGLKDVNRVGDVLQVHPAPIAVLNSAKVAGKPRGSFADDHLAAVRSPAESGCHVQRRAAVAAVRHADGFPGVDADPDFQRQARVRVRLLGEPCLEIDGSPDRLAGGREHGEPLVASNLDQDAAMSLDTVGDELDELGGEPRSSFVPVLFGEAGVAAHIGDEERAYACLLVAHDPVSMPLGWADVKRKEGICGHVGPGSCRSGSGPQPVAASSVS